ncbi:Exocyst complex component EXO84 [Ceratobasidium theobromae]|uniref:Exocyst complex component EXO84 n=1 Tax=Ceratobasidium theobromae TaxID=1582974 RepID=A0A5N5QS46_9AGAM|nr:Exocyst complex component EXO84 [Ceratobasidium theobromae]
MQGSWLRIFCEEATRVQLEIINQDGGGYDWPYEFRVWKNITGQDDNPQQVVLQYVTSTPFYCRDNNQPAGTLIQFHLVDKNGFFSRSDFIKVGPNPMVSASILSTMSVASVASLGTTSTAITTSTTSTSSQSASLTSPFTSPSSTPSPVKTNIGAIAGGIAGGVSVLAAIIVALVIFLRRRRIKQAHEKVDVDTPSIAVTPFVYDNPYHTRNYNPGQQSGVDDAPPEYTPPPPSVSHESSTSSQRSATVTNSSTAKGGYTPVSTVPH